MTDLFSPLTLRGVTFSNRIGVAPMCQYSCHDDGIPTEWHLVHLGARASGGAGMVMVEATAVTAEGRISPGDVGIWSDAHLASHTQLASALSALGTVPAIQLAHAGRKASRKQAWLPGPAEPSWETLGPSAEACGDFMPPRAMTEADISASIEAFVAATKRSIKAGYRLIE